MTSCIPRFVVPRFSWLAIVKRGFAVDSYGSPNRFYALISNWVIAIVVGVHESSNASICTIPGLRIIDVSLLACIHRVKLRWSREISGKPPTELLPLVWRLHFQFSKFGCSSRPIHIAYAVLGNYVHVPPVQLFWRRYRVHFPFHFLQIHLIWLFGAFPGLAGRFACAGPPGRFELFRFTPLSCLTPSRTIRTSLPARTPRHLFIQIQDLNYLFF